MAARICPQCAEKVKFAAVRCRYCGHEIGPASAAQVAARDEASGAKAITILVLVFTLPVLGAGGYWLWEEMALDRHVQKICGHRVWRGEKCDLAEIRKQVTDYASEWNLSYDEAGKVFETLD